MLVSDLFHSCAHEGVAEAALASIGGVLAAKVQAEARARGITVGSLVSTRVRDFRRDASEREWRELANALRGHDFPVLSGLGVIMTRSEMLGAGPTIGFVG